MAKSRVALYKAVFDLMWSSSMLGEYLYFLAVTMLLQFMTMVISSSMFVIHQKYLIPVYIVLQPISEWYGYYTDVFDMRFLKNVLGMFETKSYNSYSRLSFSSKQKLSAEEFKRLKDNARHSIDHVIMWGIPRIGDMVSALIGCVYIFSTNGISLVCIAIVMCVSNGLLYKHYIGKMQQEYFAERKQRKEKQLLETNILTLFLPLFQQKEKTPTEMASREQKLTDSEFEGHETWCKIHVLSRAINVFAYIPIYFVFYNDVNTLIISFTALARFNGAFTSMMHFINQYNRMSCDYDKYATIWTKYKQGAPPVQHKLPEVLNITRCFIHRGAKQIRMIMKNLAIRQGDKILLIGPSGDGKSTFINALMGKIKGIRLDCNRPENYFSSFVDFYQNMKEKMPTHKMTIRMLFEDSNNDTLIHKCIVMAHAHTFVESFQKQHKEKNILDVEITYDLSGGEKTRLCLATRLFKLYTKLNKGERPILILDEPEQGSDPGIAYKFIIDQIIQSPDLKDTTIIVISHLERILDIYPWNTRLSCIDGTVSQF